jgi:hypothetical protein
LLRLGAQLTRSRSQLLRALCTVAEPPIHSVGKPAILIWQYGPGSNVHELSVALYGDRRRPGRITISHASGFVGEQLGHYTYDPHVIHLSDVFAGLLGRDDFDDETPAASERTAAQAFARLARKKNLKLDIEKEQDG